MSTGLMPPPKKRRTGDSPAERKPAVSAEKKPDPSPVFSIKGDPEWRMWVDELAQHCRMTNAALVDAALVEYARIRGFAKAAPPRFSK